MNSSLPSRCCPFWLCQHIFIWIDATYVCSGDPPVTFPYNGGRGMKRTINSPDHHKWECHIVEESGDTFDIEVDCYRDDVDHHSPCPYIYLKWQQSGGISVCLGPVIMPERICDCVDAEPVVGPPVVGFEVGLASITGDEIAADPNNNCDCTFVCASGLQIRCYCDFCPCVGLAEGLQATYECASPGPGTITVDIDYYDVDDIPPAFAELVTALSLTTKCIGYWIGIATLSATCYFYVVLQCLEESTTSTLNNPQFGFIYDVGDPCATYDLSCLCFNLCVGSSQCDPLEIVFECRANSDCTGAVLSTLTIATRP